MPQIIREEKQEQALETLGELLAQIRKINSIIASGSYSFILQSIGTVKIKLTIGENQNDKIIAALKGQKKELVKEARALAKANRIAFSEKEELAMSEEQNKEVVTE